MRRFFSYVLVIFFLALASGVKAAPLATARAYLDWSQLTIRTFDVTGHGAPSITWDSESYYQWAEASAYEDYQYDESNSWDYLSVSASMGGASADATLDGTSMAAYSDPIRAGAWASAERYGTFTVSGEGLVAIGIPYEIEVSLSSFAASASTYIWIKLSNSEDEESGSGRFSDSEVILDKEGDVDGLGTWTDSGWVWVTLYFEDGETGYFTASLDTDASSPVPLPGTFVFLGSALLGLSLGKRKFFKK